MSELHDRQRREPLDREQQEPVQGSGDHVPSFDRRPTVAHAMRAYLARTESFVHNQIVTLRRYRPIVVAHHRRPLTDFPLHDGAIAGEVLPTPLGCLEQLAYRAGRIALPPGMTVLTRYLRQQEASLIHYHYLTDARFLLGLKRRTGLPAIVSGYGYDVSSFPRALHGLGLRYLRPLFDRLDCFLAMSEDMRRDLLALGCPAAKIETHYYGSDTTRWRSPERVYGQDGPLTILSVGRLNVAKGQHLVLRALRKVQRRGRVDFRVVFVGEGPLRDELERLIAEYGWQERVTLTGHIPYSNDALVHHYKAADIFAHPSITVNGLKEGIPGTIVEAMACGLPVVSTYHAGIPSVIESDRHGVLVNENDVDALACAFEALLENSSLRERLGSAAADRAVHELDLAARTVELERIYDRFV